MGLLLSASILLATNAINVAHELGHRASLPERLMSKLLYMPCLYMHFFIEHNFGHHMNVATPKIVPRIATDQRCMAFGGRR